LPEIPSFTTDLLCEAATPPAVRRTSGHRLWPSTVEPLPSVIESPKQTMVPVSDGALTSSVATQNQEVVVEVKAVPASSPVWSPRAGRPGSWS